MEGAGQRGVTPVHPMCGRSQSAAWLRWLDGAASDVEQLGGTLILTARENYFNERVRSAVHSEIITVRVPELTDPELKEILGAKGIDATNIKPAVLTRLRNPRILGIAFDLRDKVEVQNFNELSVERLLFEYIRIGARDDTEPKSPDQFSKRLADHAKEIIDRVGRQQRDDLLIFERIDGQGGHNFGADLHAVSAFFQAAA